MKRSIKRGLSQGVILLTALIVTAYLATAPWVVSKDFLQDTIVVSKTTEKKEPPLKSRSVGKRSEEELISRSFSDTLNSFFEDAFVFYNNRYAHDSASGWDVALDTTYAVVTRGNVSDTTGYSVYFVRAASRYDSLDLPGIKLEVDKDTVLGLFVALREYTIVNKHVATDPVVDYEFNVFRHLAKDSIWTDDTTNLRATHLKRVANKK